MLEGVFEINSYEIDDLLGYIKTTGGEVEAENDEAKKTFEPNKRSEVFGQGAQKINDQMDEIYNQIDHLGIAMQKGTSSIFETEMKILEEARALEIPMGFGTNDTVTDKSAGSIGLSKEDSRSVNEGVLGEAISPEINSEIEKENIEDITKSATEEQMLDENQLKVNEVGLEGVKTDETEAKDFDDRNYTENRQVIEQMENNSVGPIKDEVEINNVEEVDIEGMDQGGNR